MSDSKVPRDGTALALLQATTHSSEGKISALHLQVLLIDLPTPCSRYYCFRDKSKTIFLLPPKLVMNLPPSRGCCAGVTGGEERKVCRGKFERWRRLLCILVDCTVRPPHCAGQREGAPFPWHSASSKTAPRMCRQCLLNRCFVLEKCLQSLSEGVLCSFLCVLVML